MNSCYSRNIQRFTKGRIIAIPPFFRVPLLELPLLPYTTNVDGTVLISETKPSDSTCQRLSFRHSPVILGQSVEVLYHILYVEKLTTKNIA